MKIRIDRLGDDPLELHLTFNKGWMIRQLEGVLHEDDPGSGEAFLVVERVSGKIQVSGSVGARFSVPCGRCLEPALIQVQEPFHMIFEPRVDDGLPTDEVELTEEELHWESFEGQEIDLEPKMREQLILGVPITPLCRPDCPGIHYDHGDLAGREDDGEADLDPRWKALAKFKPTR